MKIIFLGTGTSVGVPMIGCNCEVCRSADPHNYRRRASLYLAVAGTHLVIDTPPDFRDQVLTFKVPRLDAVLYTHSHSDHVVGFDDIRRFNLVQDQVIPVYGAQETMDTLSRFFPYLHKQPQPGLSYPRVTLNAVAGPFKIGAVAIEPLAVDHAGIPTYGYRIEAEGHVIGYVPDCRELFAPAFERLRGIDVMILDALRRQPHPTHFCLEESVAQLKRLSARRAFITHMGHDLDHATTRRSLPAGIDIAYDGLTLEL